MIAKAVGILIEKRKARSATAATRGASRVCEAGSERGEGALRRGPARAGGGEGAVREGAAQRRAELRGAAGGEHLRGPRLHSGNGLGAPSREVQTAPRRRKMYLFYHSLLRRDRGRMARVVFSVAFWSKICAKGRFSRRPFHYLALLKYRVKNCVFRVFFSVYFRLSGKADGRRAAGDVFCRRVASGPRDTAAALPEGRKTA